MNITLINITNQLKGFTQMIYDNDMYVFKKVDLQTRESISYRHFLESNRHYKIIVPQPSRDCSKR